MSWGKGEGRLTTDSKDGVVERLMCFSLKMNKNLSKRETSS